MRGGPAVLRTFWRAVAFMGACLLASLAVTAGLHARGAVPEVAAIITGACLSLLPYRALRIRVLYVIAGRRPPRRLSAARLARLEAAAGVRPAAGTGRAGKRDARELEELSRAWGDACSPPPQPPPGVEEEALGRAWRAVSRREPAIAVQDLAGVPAQRGLLARLALRLEQDAIQAQCQELSARVRGRPLSLEEVICWVLLRQQLARIEARQEALDRPPGRTT